MYAIVEIAGQQFKVEEGKKIFVHRLDNEKDAIIEFNKVLLVEESGNILVGEPVLGNFIVEGKVLDHVKGDKVIVFKKKRKKGYRVKNGHRQRFTQIEIIGIGEKGSIVRKETPAKEKVKKTTKPAGIEETATEVKKAPQKKSAAKKPVAKEAEVTPKVKKTAGKKAVEKKPVAKKIAKKKE